MTEASGEGERPVLKGADLLHCPSDETRRRERPSNRLWLGKTARDHFGGEVRGPFLESRSERWVSVPSSAAAFGDTEEADRRQSQRREYVASRLHHERDKRQPRSERK